MQISFCLSTYIYTCVLCTHIRTHICRDLVHLDSSDLKLSRSDPCIPILKCRESTHSCTARVCFLHSWAVRDLNDWFRHRGHEYSKTQFRFQKQVQGHNLTLNDAQISYHNSQNCDTNQYLKSGPFFH